MTDEPFTTPGRKIPPRQPQPGALLFTFLRGHDLFTCELRNHGKYGTEAQFFQNEQFFYGRRFDTRALAVQWAEEERTAIEKGGA
jgi:hypothetical protein